MDDHEAEVGGIVQKGIADPAKIGLALLIKLDAGPDASMNEQVVAKATAVREALDELDVLERDCSLDHCKRFVVGRPRNLVGIDAVAHQALGSTEAAPLTDEFAIATKDPKKDFLVVPEKKDGLDAAAAIGAKPLNDLGRIGTAVDEIAKKNQEAFRGRLSVELSVDLGKQLLQEVEAAVNVANDVCTVS
jgi:hypothetical protein